MELDFFKFVLNHPVLVAIFSISLYFVIVNTIKMKLSKVKMVSPSELALLVNRDNAVILDVRSPAEFDAGHVAGAVRENESDIQKDNLAAIGKDKQNRWWFWTRTVPEHMNWADIWLKTVLRRYMLYAAEF